MSQDVLRLVSDLQHTFDLWNFVVGRFVGFPVGMGTSPASNLDISLSDA